MSEGLDQWKPYKHTHSKFKYNDEVTQDMRLEEYWTKPEISYTWSVEDFGQQLGKRNTVEVSLVDCPIEIAEDYDSDKPVTYLKGFSKVYFGMTPYSRSVSDMVAEFKTTKATTDLWIDLIWEEVQELFEAYADGEIPDKANLLKEMADLVYVVHGLANELGSQVSEGNEPATQAEWQSNVRSTRWDLDEAIKRVHASNMSKLDDNGEPIYNEAGKRLKGPNYKAPDLRDLV